MLPKFLRCSQGRKANFLFLLVLAKNRSARHARECSQRPFDTPLNVSSRQQVTAMCERRYSIFKYSLLWTSKRHRSPKRCNLFSSFKVRGTLWFKYTHSFDLSFGVFCFEKDDFFFKSMTQVARKNKSEHDPITLWLLVQMLYHWVTGRLMAAKASKQGSCDNILHTLLSSSNPMTFHDYLHDFFKFSSSYWLLG